MHASQIEELRETLLDIMDEVHRICSENNISYYIIGGTALGAVRHKGFIPWDTDIDIAMKREDYDRFLSISNQKLAPAYYCAYYGNTKSWYHPHALVFKKKTKIIWNNDYYRNKKECPIYIDVFPLDRVPLDAKKMHRQENNVRRKMYLQSRRECVLYQRNNMPVRMAKKLISMILHIQKNESFNRRLDMAMSYYQTEKTDYLCSMASRYNYKKQCMPESIYGTPQRYEFEGRTYYGPEQIECYLTQLFGNYLLLPPADKRTETMDNISQIIINR